MGSYQCSKCSVMLSYYGNIDRSRNYSCRYHSYGTPPQSLNIKVPLTNEKKICVDCNNKGNCRHKFRYIICGEICC